MIDRDIFDELFVLELANNHWGDLQRGLRIVKEFSTVVRYNDVRAAIKLQFRDVENFVHRDWRERQDVRRGSGHLSAGPVSAAGVSGQRAVYVAVAI